MCRLVQGHKTASSHFSQMMQILFAKYNLGLFKIIHFVDDLCFFAENEQSHLDQIEYLLKVLCKVNLKLAAEKTLISKQNN